MLLVIKVSYILSNDVKHSFGILCYFPNLIPEILICSDVGIELIGVFVAKGR
jgi:hypothetical protein